MGRERKESITLFARRRSGGSGTAVVHRYFLSAPHPLLALFRERASQRTRLTVLFRKGPTRSGLFLFFDFSFCTMYYYRMSKFPIIDIKKYGGKQVAVMDGKIVAWGTNTRDVLKKAKRKFSQSRWREITLVGVPKSLTVVYRI